MHNSSNKQVVFFSNRLSVEEEYNLFMGAEPRKELPSKPVNGNFIIPTSNEYYDPVKINYTVYEPINVEIYNVLTSMLLCEPFYNLIKKFRNRVDFYYELKFFALVNEVSELLQTTHKTYLTSLNNALSKIDKIIKMNEPYRIYEAILENLHADLIKYYTFVKKGWEVQGDKNINTIENKFVGYSPITELFVTEIKKEEKKKCFAEQFDMFRIYGNVEIEMENKIKLINIKRPVKKFPMILVLRFEGTINLKETFRFGDNEYRLRSVIRKDRRVETKACSGDHIMAFYLIKKPNN